LKIRSVAVCAALLLSGNLAPSAQRMDSNVLLQQVAAKLAALTSVSYHYSREINYESENYHNRDEQDGYIDFRPDGSAPFTFQAKRMDGFQVFNGSELLNGIRATHEVQIVPVKNIDTVQSSSFLLNSYVTLRKALPALLKENTGEQSPADCTAATCQVSLTLHQSVLTGLGDVSPITKLRDITYTLTIDRSSLLPVAVKQTASDTGNGDYTEVHFTHIDTQPSRPTDASWSYTGYPEYKLAVPGVAPKMLEIGSIAPTWQLAALGTEQKIELTSAATAEGVKFILLEFWISHCGYSIEAVQTLNSIGKRFPDVKILGLNPNDDARTINGFQKNHLPQYTLLQDTAGVSKKYGVAAYPTIYLLDRAGRILYAGDANESKIAAAIQQAVSK
jgi:thiol-disulfide isomerase/thioredoxin